jgi:hypothetical protein
MLNISGLKNTTSHFSSGYTILLDNAYGKRMLWIAMILALLTHGLFVYTSLPGTYDAYAHLFFADHYARFWFDPWEYRWYTGFWVYGYPPLVHQVIALIGKIFPLKIAMAIYAIIIIEILVIGTYRFTALFYDRITSGIAAILIVFLSSVIQTLHVFGQLPTLTGIAFLLNALPFFYQYIHGKRTVYLLLSLLCLSLVICSHHVTVIFGMFFFIGPTLYMTLYDLIPENKPISPAYFAIVVQFYKSLLQNIKYIFLFFLLLALLIIVLILPYWYCSWLDPINQVTIPHDSRDNYLNNHDAGLMFFVIPLILVISLLPSILFQILNHPRLFGWGISFLICLLLGTGGTTPLPKVILGNSAFNILTLDRFSFWCSIISIPFIAKFIKELCIGSVSSYFLRRHGAHFKNFIILCIISFYFVFIIYIFYLGRFRPLQPKEIDIEPIVNFLNRDEHMDWRYLTLGFGDQMAWLSLNTLAATVDGNYHSARRLPELTSRPVERIENAKYLGDQGIATLNDFLVKAEKYNLRYIFSNDQFYDPLLFYTGWNRVTRLENGIMVWEKNNIPKINITEAENYPKIFIYLWGLIPITVVVSAIIGAAYYLSIPNKKQFFVNHTFIKYHYHSFVSYASIFTPLMLYFTYIIWQNDKLSNRKEMSTISATIHNYYKYLDLQKFETAFQFLYQTPSYTLDKFLLEKSINEGGLIPTYAKLDTIICKKIFQSENNAAMLVNATWNTSLGKRFSTDTLQLIFEGSSWKIIPEEIFSEINPNQIDHYNYIFFRKNGKRIISTFPTVFDDRIKKPFVQYRQVNLIYEEGLYITGEILNADIFPISLLIKATVQLNNGEKLDFYTNRTTYYNLAPKGHTFFRIDIEGAPHEITLNEVANIQMFVQSDISERGYIHGGPIEVLEGHKNRDHTNYSITFFNDKVTDITIPGILYARKNEDGYIIDTGLLFFDKSIRSGLSRSFTLDIECNDNVQKVIKSVPFRYYINDQERFLPEIVNTDTLASKNSIIFLSHSFVAKELYIH